MTYSTIPEWVKVVIVILLLALVVFITYHLMVERDRFDTSIQEKTISDSDSKTKKLNKESDKVKTQIEDITTPEREVRHIQTTIKSTTDAKATIDSIALLDFNQQSIYWAREITRLDSIRSTY